MTFTLSSAPTTGATTFSWNVITATTVPMHLPRDTRLKPAGPWRLIDGQWERRVWIGEEIGGCYVVAILGPRVAP